MASSLIKELPEVVRNIVNGTEDVAEQVAPLNRIVRSLLEEIVELRNKTDKLNLKVHHVKISNEFTLLKERLTIILTFIKQKVCTRTGGITNKRKVIEDLQRKLEILERDLRKLADDLHVLASQASSGTFWSIAQGGVATLSFIAALCSMNKAAIITTGAAGISVMYNVVRGDRVSGAEINQLSDDLQTNRKKLAKRSEELNVLLWSDEWSDHDD